MKTETLTIHGGFHPDPTTTKAVATPIYQTTLLCL